MVFDQCLTIIKLIRRFNELCSTNQEFYNFIWRKVLHVNSLFIKMFETLIIHTIWYHMLHGVGFPCHLAIFVCCVQNCSWKMASYHQGYLFPSWKMLSMCILKGTYLGRFLAYLLKKKLDSVKKLRCDLHGKNETMFLPLNMEGDLKP